ncbi:MAG: class I SAM-dependent methyltransferase [Endomicrobium sp.]|jgi:SAM-dependent methyltransferase|uniref:class I SAM-dependent methyltransferase n=1 Tax=Candidatus Endomicrobiellum cubanum TaxID=3242325 RepID=UPI00282D54E8|nr:class I SAM-dependent methyltransferase [Endomicrobium sp.]
MKLEKMDDFFSSRVSIYERHMTTQVTGIDLTAKMLEQLENKHKERKLTLICGNYLDTEFGCKQFDAAVAFETMHHLSHLKKLKLYQRIHDVLCDKGVYVECDYMAETKEQEDFFFAEFEKLKNEQHIVSKDELYHYDTPCTFTSQSELLTKAGFTKRQQVFKHGCTIMLVAN